MIKWVKGTKRPLWKLITVVREIKELSSGHEVVFTQVRRSANVVADFFVKIGVNSPNKGVFIL